MMMHNTLLHIARRRLLQVLARSLVLAAVLNVMACGGGGRREMQRLLAEADSMNRNYVAFTTDTILLRAVRLADRHGSNTDRVRARYLLGCAYRDMGEAPQALDCYHQAIELADTNSADCDYRLLAKIHGQAGDLFQAQSFSHNALREYQASENLSLRVGDTLTSLLAYGQTANCYFDMYQYDSTLAISEQTRKRLLLRGDTLLANTFLAPAIAILLAREQYGEVAPLIQLYANKSEASDTSRFDPHYMMLHNYLGTYALGTGDYSTASKQFYRLIDGEEDYYISLGYLGLFNMYSKLVAPDSVFKYGSRYISLNDSLLRRWEQNHLQDVQGLYDYQRHRSLAEQQAQKVQMLWYWLLAVVAFLFLIILFFSFILYLYRLYAKARFSSLRTTYVLATLDYLHLLKAASVSNTPDLPLLEDLNRASVELADMQEDKKNPSFWGLSKELMLSPIVLSLHQTASKSRPATASQLEELHLLAKEQMPTFLEKIAPLCPREDTKQYDMCLLLRLRFSLPEICSLLDVRTQNLNTMRKRLFFKMHGTNGKARDFDKELLLMPC